MKKTLIMIMSALMLAACFTGCTKNTDSDSIGMPIPGGGVKTAVESADSNKNKNENLNEKAKTEENGTEEDKAEAQTPSVDDTQIPPDPEQKPAQENKQPTAETNTQTVPDEGKQTSAEPEQQPTLTTIQQQKPLNKPETYSGDKYLLLVNPWNYLPADFKRDTKAIEGHYIDVGAYDDIVQMLADMRKEGLSPYICSSTRTYEYQENLFNNRLKKNKAKGLSAQDALDETAKWTAIPGTSEHHTGYALDIVSAKNTVLNESQEETPEQQWMMANSWKYGFILRYPKEKTDITGIYYEPWHYRYVGKTAAKEIYESGLTLEEYLGAA